MYFDPVTNLDHANSTHRLRIRKAVLHRGIASLEGQPSHRLASWRIRQP